MLRPQERSAWSERGPGLGREFVHPDVEGVLCGGLAASAWKLYGDRKRTVVLHDERYVHSSPVCDGSHGRALEAVASELFLRNGRIRCAVSARLTSLVSPLYERLANMLDFLLNRG
jgi:hypothetical protein